MWIFLPDAFYSLRAYDSEKGGTPVERPHVVVRARVQADVEKVADACPSSFDLEHGGDYRYHLAVPVQEFIGFLRAELESLPTSTLMKDPSNPRRELHGQIWDATWDLNQLEDGGPPRSQRPGGTSE